MTERLSTEGAACRELWGAVILNAARDLLDRDAAGLDAHQAMRWLGTADFRVVCALAGVEAAPVERQLRRLRAFVDQYPSLRRRKKYILESVLEDMTVLERIA